MKKIKASFNQKDRVVCVTEQECHKFYYQPVGSNCSLRQMNSPGRFLPTSAIRAET